MLLFFSILRLNHEEMLKRQRTGQRKKTTLHDIIHMSSGKQLQPWAHSEAKNSMQHNHTRLWNTAEEGISEQDLYMESPSRTPVCQAWETLRSNKDSLCFQEGSHGHQVIQFPKNNRSKTDPHWLPQEMKFLLKP